MNLNPKLSPAMIVGVCLAALILIGWARMEFIEYQNGNPNSAKILTKAERLDLQRNLAAVAFARAITNDVVGYQRTIRKSDFIFGDDVKAWMADATVEFMNTRGGIERTNLNWKFQISGPDVLCELQPDPLLAKLRELRYEQERKEANARFWRATGMTNEPPGGYPELLK